MAVAAAPATTTTGITAKQLIEGDSVHRGHDLTRVGPVNVKRRAGHAGGTFDVWYCQDDDTLLLTIGD